MELAKQDGTKKMSVVLDGQAPGTGVEPADMQGLLKELEKERETLEQSGTCPRALAYVCREIEKIQNKTRDPPPVVDITKDIPIALSCRVPLPVKEFPKFNFVGKLLGPKGNSLKRLQESTMSRMIVCGRGSMRDKVKEEELRSSDDPKYAHLKCDPYLDIVVRAPPAEAYARLAHALTEVRPFLTPSKNDAISQSQMREMEGLMNGTGMGGPDKAPSWGMSAYPPHPRPGGPMGMKNGPPPPYGNGGPPNFSGPPGPGGYRPPYAPPAGGGFGGAQYGGGAGYGAGPGYGGPAGNAGYAGGPGGAFGPSGGAPASAGGYGNATGGYGAAAPATGTMGGFGGNPPGAPGGMAGSGAGPGGASAGRGGSTGGYYGSGGQSASGGGGTGGASRNMYNYMDNM